MFCSKNTDCHLQVDYTTNLYLQIKPPKDRLFLNCKVVDVTVILDACVSLSSDSLVSCWAAVHYTRANS